VTMRAIPLSRLLIAAALGSTLALAPLNASAFEGEVFSLKNRWEHTVTEMPANQREEYAKSARQRSRTASKPAS